MNKKEIMEILLSYYKEYGVTEEQIAEMVDAGISAGITPEFVLYNVFCQLAEEYKGVTEGYTLAGPVKMMGIPADELIGILT